MTAKKFNGMLQDPTTRWGKNTFLKYRGCVGFIASEAPDGTAAVGSCFHVGDGVFVTARHVVEGRKIIEVGFDDDITSYSLLANPKHWGPKLHGSVTIGRGPLFHDDPRVDLACFVAEPFPKEWIPLGGHLDEYLGQFELVLYRTLVLGHPPIQMSRRPILVASLGEINALAELYSVPHPHFIVSCMARGGFSGGPALVAYNEANDKGGTAALGVVTQALCRDGQPEQLGYMAVITVEPVYAMLESHGLLPGAQSLTIDTSS